MNKELRLPEPLDCRGAEGLFRRSLREELGPEERGRLRGHLLMCDACYPALSGVVDEAAERGELDGIPVPPLPEFLLRPPVPAPFGWLWRAVEGFAGDGAWFEGGAGTEHLPYGVSGADAGVEGGAGTERLPYGVSRAGAGVEGGAGTEHLPYGGVLAPVLRALMEAAPVWQKVAAAGASLGTLGGGMKEARHLDREWNPTGAATRLEYVEGPLVTAEGEFRLTVAAADPKWEGQRLACVLALPRGQRVRFEADAEPGERPGEWRARFAAGGLPVPVETKVPPVRIELFVIPGAEEGEGAGGVARILH